MTFRTFTITGTCLRNRHNIFAHKSAAEFLHILFKNMRAA